MVQILSSALCSQTPEVYIISFMRQTKFYTHKSYRALFPSDHFNRNPFNEILIVLELFAWPTQHKPIMGSHVCPKGHVGCRGVDGGICLVLKLILNKYNVDWIQIV